MVTTDEIATAEEIDRRIEAADTARRLKRSAAAQQVGELAQRRTVLATQLDEVERQLGEILADASDVLDIDELAGFTNIPAADLTGWLTIQKPNRTTRKKKSAVTTPSPTNRGPSAATTTANGAASAPPAGPHSGTAEAPDRVTAAVT